MAEAAQYGRHQVNVGHPPSDGSPLGQQSQHDALADRLSEGVQGRFDCNPGLPSANAKTQRVTQQPPARHKGSPTHSVSADEPRDEPLY